MTDESPDPVTCPVCGSTDLTSWDGIDSLVCEDCSYVIEADIDITEADTASETFSDREHQVNSEKPDWQSQISVKDNSEAILVDALSEAESVTDELSLSDDVLVRVGEVVADAWEQNFMHGRSMSRSVGAAVYAVSREQNTTVPPGMVADLVGIEKSKLKQTYKQLKEDLNLGLKSPTPSEYVEYICQTLGLSEDVKQESIQLLESVGTVGGNPIGTAAASVHEVSSDKSEEITFRQIAQVTALAKETVWRHAEKLREPDND
jgi:transcription initiation factor TFIIIB Brf1 subunit/transcription initiation factor TFIIB